LKDNLFKKLEEYNWLRKPFMEYPIVSVQDFFEENTVKGSFAANVCSKELDDKEFKKAFTELLENKDIQNIWVSLYDYDEEIGWPYSDTIFIATSLESDYFKKYFGELCPSEITENEKNEIFGKIKEGNKLLCLWWD